MVCVSAEASSVPRYDKLFRAIGPGLWSCPELDNRASGWRLVIWRVTERWGRGGGRCPPRCTIARNHMYITPSSCDTMYWTPRKLKQTNKYMVHTIFFYRWGRPDRTCVLLLSFIRLKHAWQKYVSRSEFYFFYSTRTKMHILAVMMLHQHRFCVYKTKTRKLNILTACETSVLFALLVLINISFSFAI